MKGVFGDWGVIFVGVISVIVVVVILYRNKEFSIRRSRKIKREEDDDEEEEEEEIKRRRIIQGNRGWPFIGETLDFIASGYSSNPLTFMDKRKSLYGKVFKTHILGMPIVVSTDPDVNKVVLQNNGSVFIPCYPKSITELLGKSSILQMNGTLQKRVHGLIGGFFRSPELKSRITRDIEKSVKQSLLNWKESKHLYLQEETKKITFEVLVKVLMSVGPGEEMELLKKEFEEFIKGLICLPIKLPGTRLHKSLKAKERLLKIVKKIVEERKLDMEKSSDSSSSNSNSVVSISKDAVDVLLGDTEGESNETVRHQNERLPLDFISGNIIEMMIPGEDSVPMVMTLAIKYLGDNPIALARLLEENMELKKQKAHSSSEYAWTDYTSLQFTQNVISETLRMANIINAVWRKAVKDVEIKGYLIPKGWCVLASFSAIHMDEHNYENPYDFDPSRWERREASVNNNTFTPFGGGQRLCPGLELSRLEIAIFLHHFVTTYRWVAEKDEIVTFPTVKMKRKLPIIVTPIDD